MRQRYTADKGNGEGGVVEMRQHVQIKGMGKEYEIKLRLKQAPAI
jgi:hypothetical protein